MKFPLYRFSLTEVDQLDWLDEAPKSREYFRKENIRSHIVNASIDQVIEESGSNLKSNY